MMHIQLSLEFTHAQGSRQIGHFNSRQLSITFERLRFKALAAGLVLKLVVFTQECIAE